MELFSWIWNAIFPKKKQATVTESICEVENDCKEDFDMEKINEIMQQLEYYFSPANLAVAKKLASKISHASGRFVNISVFLEYNKIKNLNATSEEIIKAVEQSDILELNEEKTKIRTKNPVQVDKETSLKRTVRFSGFPEDEEYENIKNIITTNFGAIQRLSLLHKVVEFQRVFSGKVVVEFSNDEQVEASLGGFDYSGNMISCERLIDTKVARPRNGKRANRK